MANVRAEGDRRVVGGRARNQALQRAGELALEDHFMQLKKEKRLAVKRQKDAHLASAMSSIDKQKLKQEREIAQICDNDPTLRVLKSKIQAAYMNKERVEQAKVRQLQERKLKEEDIKFFREETENREGLLKQEQLKLAQRTALREQQRDEIQAQLRRNENEARLRKIQEYVSEKVHANQIVMDIQKQVQEEDMLARKKMQDINRMMTEGLRLRKRENERRSREEQEHNRQIAEHKEKVAHRNDKRIALKKMQAEAKERIRLKIEGEALAAQQSKAKLQKALDSLRKEDRERLAEQKERDKLIRKHADKMTMMNANEQQKAEKRRRAEQDKADEAAIVAKMREKFRKDDEKAADKIRKHRQLEFNYKKDIHNQMNTRAQFFAAAKEADAKQQMRIQNEKQFREQVVEEARKAILREHAAKLKDYLPKGVFAKESDLEMLSVFDTDGDDILSAAEVSAAKKQLLAYGDVDGDGRLDAREQERAFDRLRGAVDTDGDGQLSVQERRAARQVYTR